MAPDNFVGITVDPVVPSKCQSIRHAKEPKGQVVKAIERRL